VSIEREVFPRLAREGSVFGSALPGYWLDVGTPESYLQAHRDVLERVFETAVGDALGPTSRSSTRPPTSIRARSSFLPSTSGRRRGREGLAPRQPRGARSRRSPGGGRSVENAVVGARTRVGAGASVVGSIVGDDAELGPKSELHNLAVVGPGAKLGAGNVLDHGLRIGAGQHIPDEALRFS
jgi:NDP-sugar pyrophosphorylase family protein